jgi:hypothetical protein
MKRILVGTVAAAVLSAGCARFNSTVTEVTGPDGTVERRTVVKAGTLFDSKSELAKLSSGQTDKGQTVSIGSLKQESSATNAASFAESVVGAAVRAAVRP